MPRKERLFIAGIPQLIALKGNNNEAIFRDDEDYRFFLSCLKKATEQHSVSLHAFSLLKSHVFLLLSASDMEMLARFTQYLGRCYVFYFNQRHRRTGALWEGRYRSCSIEPASYFLLCQKYVETRVGAAGDVHTDTPWSSEHANAGFEALSFLTPHATFLSLAADDTARHARYRQFMAMPLGASFVYRIEECLQQNCVLGTLNYCLELENRLHHPVRPRLSGRPRKHYPNKLNFWLWLEQEAQSSIQGYAYREIRLPLLEAQVGVELSELPSLLRSEGTMGCLQAIAQSHMTTLPARLWYQGPMFRTHHLTGQQVEQFHQIGAEALGYSGVEIELEQLMIQYDLIQRLKLSPVLELQINTLGDVSDLSRYRAALRLHFEPAMSDLSPACRATLLRAPESVLDSTFGLPEDVLQSAPQLTPFLADASLERFARLTRALESAGIPYTHNPDLFPHNPYYQQTFFEWHTAYLDTHSVVCRGGRYDEIAGRIMGRATPACGFAFMVEPLIQLAEKSRAGHQLSPQSIDVAILNESPACAEAAVHLGHVLRVAYPYLAVVNDYTRGRLSGRQARAIKNGARIVINLREPGQSAELLNCEPAEQVLCPVSEVVSRVRGWLI